MNSPNPRVPESPGYRGWDSGFAQNADSRRAYNLGYTRGARHAALDVQRLLRNDDPDRLTDYLDLVIKETEDK